ncbi:putative uncharacterized protein [Parachlamydia acanthamoebae UV-7]|uniref:Uncharacterized protein n=2 Tax=Parachlamydia acanthamoebae TaxID=83552 RepID=F8KVW7_PARAV|nr:hypothetical protein [Parachlamydia acanthamoebae]EFB42116.1 hypothetical protein pah_c014o020 [Parachlamydia acanthamoebae str. Hall's coccus]KIA76271.1 hypothetical protein DB43_AO00100 [Parachlamydia acanthamoebae]CCB85262.1 putative uncharacterized protein [Parachlamydia acanthamoebae UV-7]
MPFSICKTKEDFHCQVLKLQKISEAHEGYLNTRLNKSEKKDSKVVAWLKWLISLTHVAHLTQTSPLRVAREVAKFAEKHQKFLYNEDQQILIAVLNNHKKKILLTLLSKKLKVFLR